MAVACRRDVRDAKGGVANINGEWLGLGMIPRIIRRLRTCGAPLTMRAKSWSSTSPRNETNLRLCGKRRRTPALRRIGMA